MNSYDKIHFTTGFGKINFSRFDPTALFRIEIIQIRKCIQL